MSEYQLNYSKINVSLYDNASRQIKAIKIGKIIKDFSRNNSAQLKCLEIGCSTGINTNFLSDSFAECIGIDIDFDAVKFGHSNRQSNGHFFIGDAMRLPFRSDVFDVILCNHVYEHVPDSGKLMDEIFRVLKTGGFCYFAAGNKYAIIEGHYHLPFLSWFPRPFSNMYLRLTGKGSLYYEKHLSYFQLKRLTRRFSVTDYTLKVIRNSGQFGAEDMIRPDSLVSKIPLRLLNVLLPLVPTYIFILTKK